MPMDPALWKTVALLAFFLFFLGVLLWTVRVGRTGRFRHDASLPLDEGRLLDPQSMMPTEEKHV